MSLTIIVAVALAWCAWLVFDAVQECRKIDRQSTNPPIRHSVNLSDCLEARR